MEPAAALSAYDEAVPHPAPDPALTHRFADLRAARRRVDIDAVTDVVFVVSSSRGGSSMLAEILRRHPQLLSLPGEMNPYVVVSQLAGGDAGIVREELAREIGRPAVAGQAADLDRLAGDVAWRLTAQWPAVEIDPVRVRRAVAAGASAADPADAQSFTTAVLAGLGDKRLRASSYDGLGTSEHRCAAPQQPVIEMAPYVPLRGWLPPEPDELRRCPLVIATPRNSFRLEWLPQLLPHARMHLIHLTRNPAASVNGLIDGWHHDGFFTTTVDADLAIEGYSNRYPWGRRWWKYDVPPRWRTLVASPLATVAAEQWRAAHAALLAHSAGTAANVLRLRYEDLVGSVDQRAAVALQLASFLGVDAALTAGALMQGAPPVMATTPPAARRWRSSDHDLAVALAEPSVWEVAAALGYEPDEASWI